MKYIVYQTINIVNNKIYIGVHKTENPEVFDGYFGCGLSTQSGFIKNPKTPFHYAVKKYGFKNFKRTTLKVFDNLEDALDLERWLVCPEFIARKDTYNITLGGGMPPLLNKEVYQYALDGTFIQKWNSIQEIVTKNNYTSSAISTAIAYKHASYNFLWSDKLYTKLNVEEYYIYDTNVKNYLYDSFGVYLKQFNSLSETVKYLNSNLSNVQRAIKLGYSVKGYYISLVKNEVFVPIKRHRLTGDLHKYDLNGKYICSYSSINQAETEMKTSLSGVNQAIKLNNGYYKNFLWCRGEKLPFMYKYKSPTQKRKIGQYKDGKLVNIFESVRMCRKQFGNISKVLSGQAKQTKGYTFKYLN